MTVRLEGIDLVVFDKDGTLIDFGPMWSGWAETLAANLEGLTGRRLTAALYEMLGYDPARRNVRPGGGLADHLSQPIPSRGRSDIHDLLHARRPEPEEHLGGGGIVLGHERDGRDAGELVHQVPDGLHLLRRAAMDRQEHGVHRPLPHHPHRVGHRVAVHPGETAVAGRVHPADRRRVSRRSEHTVR